MNFRIHILRSEIMARIDLYFILHSSFKLQFFHSFGIWNYLVQIWIHLPNVSKSCIIRFRMRIKNLKFSIRSVKLLKSIVYWLWNIMVKFVELIKTKEKFYNRYSLKIFQIDWSISMVLYLICEISVINRFESSLRNISIESENVFF